MSGDDVRGRRVAGTMAAMLAVVALALAVAFALLVHWQLPAGGEADSRLRLAPFPAPRLQEAPQASRPWWGAGAAPRAPLPAPASPTASTGFTDADGHPVPPHASSGDGRVTVLLPAWYRCRSLCGTVAHGALEALADTGLPPATWRLVIVSLDPTDTPADARPLRDVYRRYAAWARPAVYGATPAATALPLQLWTSDADGLRALRETLGWRWTLTAVPGDGDTRPGIDHPAGLAVLRPDGTLSARLPGVRFDPAVLRAAMLATGGTAPAATSPAASVHMSGHSLTDLATGLWLACSSFDPHTGRATAPVMWTLRALALLALAAGATWAWRHREATR